MTNPAPEMGQPQTTIHNPAPRGYSEEIITRAELYIVQGIRRRNALRMAQREMALEEIGGPNPYRNRTDHKTNRSDITGITAAWRADRPIHQLIIDKKD